MSVKVGDYVFDWDFGIWGLILERKKDPQGGQDLIILLAADGETFESFENALGTDQRQLEREGKWAV